MMPDVDPRIAETIRVLNSLSGGAELLSWFGGRPEFGDGEILNLDLNRRGASLSVATMMSEKGHYGGPPFKHAVIRFYFKADDMIDVSLEGFSHQNVIGGLWLRFADTSAIDTSLVGVGLGQGDIEFEIEPCFGGFGRIRASVEKITVTSVADYQKADDPSSMIA